MANRYVSSVDYAALTQWAASTTYAVGDIRRPLTTLAFGKELVYRVSAITTGTSNTTEPVWPTTAGGTVVDSGVTWAEVTSNATYNSAAWTTAPFGTVVAATTLGTAGDTYYIAHTHSEVGPSGTNVDLGIKGNVPNGWGVPIVDRLLCVNRAGTMPNPVAADLTTGASISSSGNGQLIASGSLYAYGLKLSCGSGANSPIGYFGSGGGSYVQVYDTCQITQAGTISGGAIRIGGVACNIKFLNCTWSFGHAGQLIQLQGSGAIFDGPSSTTFISGTSPTIPNTLFNTNGGQLGSVVRNADLSNATGAYGILVQNNSGGRLGVQLINCKVPAASNLMSASGGTTVLGTSPLDVIGSNSGSNVERNERYMSICYMTTETTVVRTGGASDGATAYSWKLVPQNNGNSVYVPFESFEGIIWNSAIGSAKTLTVHCITTGNITLNNNELWLEVDYLGQSGNPMASRVSSFPATVLTAATALPLDNSAVWASGSLTTPVQQRLQLTFTPLLTGPVRWRLRYARTTGTVYVCPKAELV